MSIVRNSTADSSVVLVTAPGWSKRSRSDGLVQVEAVRFENVDIPKTNLIKHFVESRFGGETKDGHLTEMKEMPLKVTPSPNQQTEADADFDACQQYNFDASGENEKEEAGDLNGPFGTMSAFASAVMSSILLDGNNSESPQSNPSVESVSISFVLGKTYHPLHDYSIRRDDERSLFWFTYRCDFPEIAPYNITSDAGWGCMLRSAQMMLGQALRLHFKSRDWRPPQLLARRRQDSFIRSVLTWFADYPSSSESVYSLHNMVAAGLSKYDKLPGEWYGPGTACYVMRDLVHIHEKQQALGKTRLDRRIFRVYVAPQGTVYRDTIHAFMTTEARVRIEEKKKVKEQTQPQAHPLDLEWEEELMESANTVEWDTALLLLVPLRLGLNSLNEEYVQSVAHTFSLPQSVGVLGGRPRGARWFYGAQKDGSKIFGLDPHTVQTAPRRRTARVNGQASSVVELSDDYLRSCHTTCPEMFPFCKMDPSIALGFYCRTRADLNHVLNSMGAWQKEHSSIPELFSVLDRAPDYSANVDDLLLGGDSSMMETSGFEDEASDADEYVML